MYQLTSDSLTGTPITVTVGDRNPSTFFVHKSVISPTCELFELILDECTDDSIHLDECEPAIFKVYLQWLYTSTIPMCTVSSKSPDTCKITVLGKAYLLGEYLMDGTFKDAIADAILMQATESHCLLPTCSDCFNMVLHMYKNTLDSDLIRTLLVDAYAWRAQELRPNWVFSSMAKELPKEFLLGVLRKWFNMPSEPPSRWPRCLYHGHGKGCCHHEYYSPVIKAWLRDKQETY